MAAATRTVGRDLREDDNPGMSFGQSILVVEDDAELRGVLAARPARGGLRGRGRRRPGAALLDRVEQVAPDALVIDIGLPDADGRDVCQALRAAASRRRCCS